MTINPEASASVVRSLVRGDAAGRTFVREAAADSSEFSRVLHNESAATRLPEAAVSSPSTAQAATPATPAACSIAAPVTPAQALHYNVQGLCTARGEASVPAVVQTPATATPAADVSNPFTVCPTAEEVFGANPWMTSPTGRSADLGAYNYNPLYFATRQTAEKVAQLLGGTVVEKNAMVGSGGPFIQNQANYMVQLPNGHLVNAGLTASYYTHGWSQSQINQMLEYDRQV